MFVTKQFVFNRTVYVTGETVCVTGLFELEESASHGCVC